MFVGISEQDPRRGAVDFGKEAKDAPLDLKCVVADTEFLAFRRRRFEADAMYAELLHRSGVLPASSGQQAAEETRPVPAVSTSSGGGGGGSTLHGARIEMPALLEEV